MPLLGMAGIDSEKKNFDASLQKYEEAIEIFLTKRKDSEIPLVMEAAFFEVGKLYGEKNNI